MDDLNNRHGLSRLNLGHSKPSCPGPPGSTSTRNHPRNTFDSDTSTSRADYHLFSRQRGRERTPHHNMYEGQSHLYASTNDNDARHGTSSHVFSFPVPGQSMMERDVSFGQYREGAGLQESRDSSRNIWADHQGVGQSAMTLDQIHGKSSLYGDYIPNQSGETPDEFGVPDDVPLLSYNEFVLEKCRVLRIDV
jgi:hypothetical protein